MGPSVGWVSMPDQSIVPITTTGTTNIQRGMNVITVNVNATVTVQLYSVLKVVSPQAIPAQSMIYPVIIVDIGGFANSTTAKITILPASGKTIDGLASIAIQAPYGAYALRPIIETGNWTLTQ